MNPDSMISRMMNRVETFVFYHPKIFLSAIVLITIFFASRVPYVQMYSDFADLLPQDGRVNFSGALYQNVAPILAPLASAAGTAGVSPGLAESLIGAEPQPGLALLYGDEDRIELVSSTEGGIFTQSVLSGLSGWLSVQESLQRALQQGTGQEL